MKKSVLAMTIVAMMATGCGANGGTDAVNEQSAATEQTSEQSVTLEQAAAQASEEKVEEAAEEASEETTEEAAKNATVEAAKDASKEAPAEATSSLKDGDYDTDLVPEPSSYSPCYVKNVKITDDAIILEAFVCQLSEGWTRTEIGYNTYTLPLDSNAQYLSGGGEDVTKIMSKEEFSDYLSSVMNTGLELAFTLKGGRVVSIGIYS
ncbi:MAG: hypothetical protein J5802_13210 [Butyrivibrio sp.]|nr:hypothetical protein [Butyrivibrio sp.]